MSDNRAWVTVETRLNPEALDAFRQDLERLFRLNPLRVIEVWQTEGERVTARWLDLAKDRTVETTFTVRHDAGQTVLRYASGLKTETVVAVEGNKLIFTETYADLPETELDARRDEIDNTLTAWGHGVHDFLTRWRRWHRLPGWQWYIARVWLPMSPGARRIVSLLILLSWIELAVFAAMAAILGAGFSF